jgi:hypothetical protein
VSFTPGPDGLLFVCIDSSLDSCDSAFELSCVKKFLRFAEVVLEQIDELGAAEYGREKRAIRWLLGAHTHMNTDAAYTHTYSLAYFYNIHMHICSQIFIPPPLPPPSSHHFLPTSLAAPWSHGARSYDRLVVVLDKSFPGVRTDVVKSYINLTSERYAPLLLSFQSLTVIEFFHDLIFFWYHW